MLNIVFGRTTLRRVLQTTIAGALVVGLVASFGTPAVAAPEKVLQSVSVSLGSDSSIQSISSTAVSAGSGEGLASDDASLDPTTVAADLPVRITTTYRLGDRSGTDLSEIEGEAGRVVIDVTVQNITARPETLTYDFNGTQRQQNALVATPMTVVASAQLGEDSLGSVVTSDDITPDEVTNGVVGRGSEQAADVQWAALLAPPRLGASATFRLVQDTEDFAAPAIDLSVQPGLVSDPSVERLLEAAFADDPSSTLKLESATIELVSNVNTILTGASGVLVQIQNALGSSAGELGQRTISDLESSSSLVSSSLSGLAGDLSSLNGQMAGEMSKANQVTVRQFEDTVSSMKELIGNPSDFSAIPTGKKVQCAGELPQLGTAGSITRQMIAITAQLKAIKSATGDCQQRIKDGLAAAIGSPDDDSLDSTVIGTIRATQAGLDSEIASLTAEGEDVSEDFDSTLLGDVNDAVGRLGPLVGTIQEAAEEIKGKGSEHVRGQLQELLNLLNTVESQAVPELTDLFDDVNDAARTQLEQLDEDVDDNTIQQVVDARDAMCDLAPDGTPHVVDTGDLHATSLLLVGVDCDGDGFGEGVPLPGSYSTPVVTRMAETRDALVSISELSDTEDGDADEALDDLVEDHLAPLSGLLDELLDDDDAPTRSEIDDLKASLAMLSDDRVPYFGEQGPEWPQLKFSVDDSVNSEALCAAVGDFALPTFAEGEEPSGYVAPDPLERLHLFDKKMSCNQVGIGERIAEAFAAGSDILGDTRDGLEGQVDDIDGAREAADDNVDQLVSTLTSALDESSVSIRTEGKRSVTTQGQQLDASKDTLAGSLDERVAESIRRIEGTVASANRNLRASERALLGDLDDVLLDLGDRSNNGTGLLGAISKGAADTGTAGDTVIRANQTASEFAGVRSTALEDVFLQQAQLTRSLELLQAFPAFGIDLPSGSSHVTVFSFSFGES